MCSSDLQVRLVFFIVFDFHFFISSFISFYVLFNLVFSRLYAVFYDLSSLGNFFNFRVDIIVLILFGGFMHFVYFMQSC